MSDAFDAEPVLRVAAPQWFRDALAVPFERRSVRVTLLADWIHSDPRRPTRRS